MTINGVDISSWDDDPNTPAHVNFDILSTKTRYCIARAGYGGWVDRDFLRSWVEMKRTKMLRGAYWYVTDQVAPRAAAQAFVTAMGGDYGNIPPCADYENANWASGPKVAVLREFVEEVKRLTGKTCMIYTGYYVWTEHGSTDPYWKQYPLWIANYNVSPLIPSPWTGYKFWQYTDRLPAAGMGVESLMMDDNKYYGTEAQFAAEFAIVAPPVDPPAPPQPVVYTVLSVTVRGVKIPEIVKVAFTNGSDQNIDQRPVVMPPAQTNLYRVAAELWPVNHGGLSQPPAGGPLTQTLSTTAKKAYFETPLGVDWVKFIASFNTKNSMDKITAPDFGPSKGFNSAFKLRYIGLVWPGVNVVKVLETSGEWAHIASIPLDITLASHFTPATHPWLFHKVCDNRGNPVLVQGAPIVCPIIGDVLWCPMSALVRL